MSYKYLLDANVFIQANNFYYPKDIFPGFWDWIEKQNKNKVIASIDSIRNELSRGDDELSEWAKTCDKKEWFLPEDDENTQNCFGDIVNWIQEHNQFKDVAKEEFIGVADPWLIAKAKSSNSTIVTQEKSAPNSKRKIYIPDVCNYFNVSYINTIDLIRTLGGRF